MSPGLFMLLGTAAVVVWYTLERSKIAREEAAAFKRDMTPDPEIVAAWLGDLAQRDPQADHHPNHRQSP